MFILKRLATTAAAAVNEQHQWPVTFQAENSSDNSPAFIFVHRSAVDGEFGEDFFTAVASAIQMYDLPEGVPTNDSVFFRKSEVTLLLRSAVAAEEFIAKIQGAVQDLADNLYAANTLEVVEEITITPTQQP